VTRCRIGRIGAFSKKGLTTNLHDRGVDDKTIQAILRHSNVPVSQACYIKTLPEQSIADMNALESYSNRPSKLTTSLLSRRMAP
jgi:ornithine carbamoyltransferase